MSSVTIDQIEAYCGGLEYPQDFSMCYAATKNIVDYSLIIPDNLLESFKSKLNENKFFLPDDSIALQLLAGVIKGNLILQGPPGTGKTSLARIIAELFDVELDVVTATSDWTTYDTLGGYQPDVDDDGNEVVVGKNGSVVRSILNCCDSVVQREKHKNSGPQACWLIVDELNRTEIDKVFGDLFTVFGGSAPAERKLSLPFHNKKELSEIFVPRRFRIIGTINNVDKNFVFNLSQGLSRRFTFVTINPPALDDFSAELDTVEKSILPDRISSILSMGENSTFNEERVKSVIENDNYKRAKHDAIELFKLVRYSEDELEGGLGLEVGTAQLIDVLETAVIYLMLQEITSKTAEEQLAICRNAFDLALAGKVFPQMEGFSFENLKKFGKTLNGRPGFDVCKKQLQGFIA